MKKYVFEYLDDEGLFEEFHIKAEDRETAWFKIKEYAGIGAVILGVYEEIFSGEWLVE
jgi:hypothetical protein